MHIIWYKLVHSVGGLFALLYTNAGLGLLGVKTRYFVAIHVGFSGLFSIYGMWKCHILLFRKYMIDGLAYWTNRLMGNKVRGTNVESPYCDRMASLIHESFKFTRCDFRRFYPIFKWRHPLSKLILLSTSYNQLQRTKFHEMLIFIPKHDFSSEVDQ